jgi:hypothetical protein
MNTKKSHTGEFKYFSIESESREQYFKRAVTMLSGLALTLSSVSGCASTNNELKPISTPSSILSPESTPATDPSRVVDQGELPTADQIVDIMNTPGECVMMAAASVPVNYKTSSGNMNSGEAVRPLVSIDGRLSASGGICEGVLIGFNSLFVLAHPLTLLRVNARPESIVTARLKYCSRDSLSIEKYLNSPLAPFYFL